jgi:tetratricopeptide (TPR) repeat protein
MRAISAIFILILTVLSIPDTAGAQSGSSIAAFAFGRGGGSAGAKAAVDVQHTLRELIPSTGTHRHVDMLKTLHPEQIPPRKDALEKAGIMLKAGKAAYEQLDLEQAQEKLKNALKKYELGYAFLDKSDPLLETLMNLGATLILVGKPEKAQNLFTRAQDLPGRKVLDPNLFPPNIQDIFNQTSERAQHLPRSSITLASTPPGAKILVDETYRGGSPAKVDKLRVGIHMVRALKDGYLPWGGKINVTAGKHKQLWLKLQPARKQKTFSRHFQRMAAEVTRKDPGDSVEKMGKLLKAKRIVVVAARGSTEAVELDGYLCDLEGEVKCASVQKTLNRQDVAFRDNLKDFCLRLLKATPQSEVEEPDESFAKGAIAAATLLENAEKGEIEDGEVMGLDLGAEAPPNATTEDIKATEEAEKQEKKIEASLKAQKKKEEDQTSPSTWSYLSRKWWFWTAVGVVAAGAATGTYFLVSGGEESTGGLVINIH